jgi:thiamine-phosphate pyrophosphorylase
LRRFKLPPLYPITDTEISGLSHSEQVRLLCAGGATLIQLRDKKLSPADFYAEARAAVSVGRSLGAKILINDRVDVCLALGADGVHLGQDDLHPEEARKILGEGALIGFSTHSVEQAREAITFPIDYFAIGPIFDTRTKSNPDPVVGLAGLSRVRAIAGESSVVAIGGITPSRASEVLAAGADSVAMIGGLLHPADTLTQRTQQLLKALSKY